MMKIVVVGQGAIGSLWATHLAKLRGVELSIMPTTVNPIDDTCIKASNTNITISHFYGATEQLTLPVATSAQLNQADMIMVCVKAYHVKKVIEQIQPKLHKNTILALCHNGMGTLDEINAFVPKTTPIIAMLTTHGAFRPKKSHVIHTGLGRTDIGLVNTPEQSNTKEWKDITARLNDSLPSVYWQDNIKEKQWLKLAVNCVINPITALNHIKNGQITQEKYQSLISSLCNEISQVAKLEQINIEPDALQTIVTNVAINTADNQSSMLCDVINKQTTEIDYINGYLIEIANLYKVNVSANKQLFQQVKILEASFLS